MRASTKPMELNGLADLPHLSFLSRLRRFEHSIGLIVLEQLVLSPAAAMGYVLCAGRQPERHDVSQAQARARPQHLCV